jgi:hypothetical protein
MPICPGACVHHRAIANATPFWFSMAATLPPPATVAKVLRNISSPVGE